MRHLYRYVTILLVLLVFSVAYPISLSYDFGSDPSADWDFYELVDDSGYEAGSWDIWNSSNGYLELVEDGTDYAMGTAWINEPLPSGYFDVEFKFQQTNSSAYLDGFTFGWVEAEGSKYGNIGGNLGAYIDGWSQHNAGYTGYFVETDYFKTDPWDPNRYHFGLMSSGPNYGDPAALGATHEFASDQFQTGNWYGMRVVGDNVSSGCRTVTIWADTDEDSDPWGYDVSYSWDIDNYDYMGQRYFGFTSGTGGLTGSVRIDDVDIEATPEPGTFALVILGLVGMELFRRHRQ